MLGRYAATLRKRSSRFKNPIVIIMYEMRGKKITDNSHMTAACVYTVEPYCIGPAFRGQ